MRCSTLSAIITTSPKDATRGMTGDALLSFFFQFHTTCTLLFLLRTLRIQHLLLLPMPLSPPRRCDHYIPRIPARHHPRQRLPPPRQMPTLSCWEIFLSFFFPGVIVVTTKIASSILQIGQYTRTVVLQRSLRVLSSPLRPHLQSDLATFPQRYLSASLFFAQKMVNTYRHPNPCYLCPWCNIRHLVRDLEFLFMVSRDQIYRQQWNYVLR